MELFHALAVSAKLQQMNLTGKKKKKKISLFFRKTNKRKYL